ncbi:hypothetical protein G7046_g6466 [Stylonectria norvegica]|nr:hypothetical protein G7046_g6466 [Stylonectria norvegica]
MSYSLQRASILLCQQMGRASLARKHFCQPLALPHATRFKRYEAFDSQLDQDALAEARAWYQAFDPSQLPKGNTTYARSSGPGGQHVNKTETKAISVYPIKDLITVLPKSLHSSIRASKYYTVNSDALTFQAQTSRSRDANAEDNRKKLVDEVRRIYQEATPAGTSDEKKQKHKEIGKRFHEHRVKEKRLTSLVPSPTESPAINISPIRLHGFCASSAGHHPQSKSEPPTPTPNMDAAARQQPQVQPCRYKVGKTLGAGSYSVVKECVHIDTGRYYAAKVINKRLMAGREHMVRNEIAVLKKVSMGHQNILTLVDYFETMNNLYLVTDLALGGELFDRICRKGSYYESDAADLIRATLSAVAYLHDHGIVHRDLKPENLLFRTPEDNADLLIADFGLSRIMDEEQFHVLTTTCGTPGYMAPEIFKKTGHGKPVDLWALGVITYFLLCGYTPFDRDSDFEEMQAILNADYSFTPIEYWRDVSSHAKDFIRKCLTIDATKRITAHEALQHPFVAEFLATEGEGQNLLPNIKKNFNARRTLHAAIDTVRAINKLREAQNGMMDGARSKEPTRGAAALRTQQAGARKEDSAISMGKDSGYATQPEGDVVMGNTSQYSVPASLQVGNDSNRVVETSKGLWTGKR